LTSPALETELPLTSPAASPLITKPYLGDKNANTLTGSSNDEIFVAGAGDDTLTGNGGLLNPKFNISICIGVTMSVNIISDTIKSATNSLL
jgi:hypothetical protein